MPLISARPEPDRSGAVLRRRAAPAILACFLVTPAGALADTLTDALADAYVWHPSVQSARAEVRVAEARVTETGTQNAPRATADLNSSLTERTAKSATSTQTSAKPLVASARLSLSKEIYDFGRVRERVGVDRSLLDAARYRLQAIEQDVLYDAAVAYLNVFRAQARVELAIKGEELVENDLQATRERFEVGDVTPTDVAQAEARLADRKADRLNRAQDLEHARREFRLATGSDFSESAVHPGDLPVVPASELEVEDNAISLHPAVLMRRARLEAATRADKATVLEILPTLELSGTASYSRNPNTFFESSTDLSVGVNASVPLWSGGRLDAAMESSEARLAQTRRELDSEMRRVRQVALSAWHRFRSAAETIAALEASVRANRIASEGVRREAEVGNRTTLDVLNANQELLVAEDRLNEAQHVLQVAAYGLLRATGHMTAAHWEL